MTNTKQTLEIIEGLGEVSHQHLIQCLGDVMTPVGVSMAVRSLIRQGLIRSERVDGKPVYVV